MRVPTLRGGSATSLHEHPNFHKTERFLPDPGAGDSPSALYDTAMPWPHGPASPMRPFNTVSRRDPNERTAKDLGPGEYHADNHTMLRAAEQEGQKNRKVGVTCDRVCAKNVTTYYTS